MSTPSQNISTPGQPEAAPVLPAAGGRQSFAGVRLRRHADYQRAYAASRKKQSASMSWFLAPQSEDISGPRVGLTAGRVVGKAHERNRIKRRLRDIVRRHLDLLPEHADLILHPRRVVLTMEFRKLESELVRILTQAKVEAARMTKIPDRATPDSGTPRA